MIALFYLLGFISGAAACALIKLIVASKKRRQDADRSADESFLNILNY